MNYPKRQFQVNETARIELCTRHRRDYVDMYPLKSFGSMGIYNTKGAYPIVESPLCLMLVREV